MSLPFLFSRSSSLSVPRISSRHCSFLPLERYPSLLELFYRRPASHIHGYSPMAHPGTIASSFYQTCILRSPSLLSEKRSISSTHIHHHIVVLNYSQVASKPLHPRKGPFPNWRTRDSTADRADSRLHRNYLSISYSTTHHTYLSTILSSFLPFFLSQTNNTH